MHKEPVILYVEDDPRSRKVMQMWATTEGVHNLYLFEDTANFIARAEALEPTPTVIFLDIHIKPHNGFEVLTMLRQSPCFAGVPVVAMTASVMNEEVMQLRTSGFDGCLAKPVDMETFLDTLQRIMTGEYIWHIFQ